ncbi:MAG: ATP-grasp domain-containing protein [Candidatus Promineifilaceae bacterium]
MSSPKRVLLLLTPRTYRARAFIEAAEKLEIEVVKAIDMDRQLADYWHYRLGLDYTNAAETVEKIVEFAAESPLGAIVSVDDSGSLIAAQASQRLGLPHNSPEAAEAARDKHRMRQLLAKRNVQAPRSTLYYFNDPTNSKINQIATEASYPCVLKPLNLSGSRGVIRADNTAEFLAAAERLRQMLFTYDPTLTPKPFLVEEFVPGFEVALEGILDNGRLRVLALFDKPDPLDGPFFEETIYVTPSRLPQATQEAIFACTADAAAALGLREGPVHAELRVNENGPYLIEVAGRSIGGLCSQTLRFGSDASLEELILRQAFDLPIETFDREKSAGGVMMIPIPEAGLLKKVEGCEAAGAVPLIESVEITARLNYSITPLPEGDSYLGFIFAHGETPEAVEAALREAHSKLHFEIAPELRVFAG